MSSRLLGPVALLVVMALAGAAAGAPAGAPAGTAGSRGGVSPDRPWSGYHIPVNGHADGGWIGGRKLSDKTLVYRIDPTASGAASTYGKAKVQDRIGRHGHPVSTRNLTRAAWILATYGTYPLAVQSAAVDAATYQLLVGGAWRITRHHAISRIQHAQYPKYIAKYVREMLGRSARYAGPYYTFLQTTPATTGGTTTATMKVTSRAGKAMDNIDVVFRYPGAKSVTTSTDEAGLAHATFTVGSAEVSKVNAVVRRLPEWRLFVRTPTHKGASRVAVAGRHFYKSVRADVSTTGVQVVTLTNARSIYSTSQALGGQWTLIGYGGDRDAVISVYGPFASKDGSSCGGTPVAARTQAVDKDGTFALPGGPVATVGYYRYGIAVSGNAANQAGVVCGDPVRVRAVPTISITKARSPLPAGKAARGHVDIAGLQSGAAVSVTARLYGPFPTAKGATCAKSRLYSKRSYDVMADGDSTSPSIRPPAKAGGPAVWYLWTAAVTAAEFSAPARSKCRAAGSFLQVSPT